MRSAAKYWHNPSDWHKSKWRITLSQSSQVCLMSHAITYPLAPSTVQWPLVVILKCQHVTWFWANKTKEPSDLRPHSVFILQAMDMLGSSLGHTSLSLGGLGDLGLGPDSHGLGHGHHEHLHPHQPLPPHRPLSPPVLPSHSHSLSSSSAVDSSFSPGSSSHLPSSTVKIKPGEYFAILF